LINVVLWTVAAAAFAAAGFKARGLRNSTPPPGLGSACLLLATVGLALVLISNGAQRVENAVYPNSGRLLSNLCTMVAAFAALAHVMCVTCPPRKARVRIRRGLVALLVAMTAMTALFVSSRLPPVIAGFGSLYRDHPKLVGYALIYVGFSGWALMALALTAVRYAGPAARPPLRTGLWIVAVGCLVGVVYLVDKAVVVVTQGLRLRPLLPNPEKVCSSPLHPPHCLSSVGLPALAVLAITMGMTLPAWGPAAAAPVRWLRYRRTYRRLDPLWRALTTAMPQIVLPRSGRDRFSYRYGVQRRVIEIRDGLLLIGPYRGTGASHGETTTYGAGLDPRQAAALREANSVRIALTAYQSGRPAGGSPDRTDAADHGCAQSSQQEETMLNSDIGNNLDSEADWLVQVSSAFSISASSAGAFREDTRPGRR